MQMTQRLYIRKEIPKPFISHRYEFKVTQLTLLGHIAGICQLPIVGKPRYLDAV